MAKGAANEGALGKLHSKLATVFTKVLERYESKLDELTEDKLADEMLEEFEPSPAMLSAIAKFLKDNEIGLDTEEVEKLNATERRLQEQREKRKRAGVRLSVVPLVAEG